MLRLSLLGSTVSSCLPRQKLFKLQFGHGSTRCPLGGMLAPEMAAGHFLQWVERMWRNIEADLFIAPLPYSCRNRTDTERELLLKDLQSVQVYIISMLQLKLHFWNVLPWYETEAVAGAKKVLEMFLRDPREEVHHPYTWYMMSDRVFRRALEQHASGKPRSQLHPNYRQAIAKFRFFHIVETCVEALHAVPSKETKTKYVGPVPLSLANKWPLFQRWVAVGHARTTDLVHAFESTRDDELVRKDLGLEHHPRVRGCTRDRLHQRLIELVYNVDLVGMYRDLRVQRSTQQREHRRRAAEELKLTVAQRPRTGNTYESSILLRLLNRVRSIPAPATFVHCRVCSIF